MRRIFYILALLFTAVAGIFIQPLLYVCGVILLIAVISAVKNLADRSVLKAELQCENVGGENGENNELRIMLDLSGKGNTCGEYKGKIRFENMLTHQKTEKDVRFKIGENEKSRLDFTLSSAETGGIRTEFSALKRYDICGLTCKKVKAEISGRAFSMPKITGADDPAVRDMISRNELLSSPSYYGGEVSGAREYRDGDDLRFANQKLTMRFSKPYIKEFSPDKEGTLCLMYDGTYGDDPSLCGQLADRFFNVSAELTRRKIPHYIAICGGNVFCEPADNISSAVKRMLELSTEKGEPAVYRFAAGCPEKISQIVCFSAHSALSDKNTPVRADRRISFYKI